MTNKEGADLNYVNLINKIACLYPGTCMVVTVFEDKKMEINVFPGLSKA